MPKAVVTQQAPSFNAADRLTAIAAVQAANGVTFEEGYGCHVHACDVETFVGTPTEQLFGQRPTLPQGTAFVIDTYSDYGSAVVCQRVCVDAAGAVLAGAENSGSPYGVANKDFEPAQAAALLDAWLEAAQARLAEAPGAPSLDTATGVDPSGKRG